LKPEDDDSHDCPPPPGKLENGKKQTQKMNKTPPKKIWTLFSGSPCGSVYFRLNGQSVSASVHLVIDKLLSRWWQLKYFLFSPRSLGK